MVQQGERGGRERGSDDALGEADSPMRDEHWDVRERRKVGEERHQQRQHHRREALERGDR
jgi:hypothetical protein